MFEGVDTLPCSSSHASFAPNLPDLCARGALRAPIRLAIEILDLHSAYLHIESEHGDYTPFISHIYKPVLAAV